MPCSCATPAAKPQQNGGGEKPPGCLQFGAKPKFGANPIEIWRKLLFSSNSPHNHSYPANAARSNRLNSSQLTVFARGFSSNRFELSFDDQKQSFPKNIKSCAKRCLKRSETEPSEDGSITARSTG